MRNHSGVFIYTVLNGLIGLVVCLSGGYLEPREYDLKEYWTWKGSGKPTWFVRAMRRRRNRRNQQNVSAGINIRSFPVISSPMPSQRSSSKGASEYPATPTYGESSRI